MTDIAFYGFLHLKDGESSSVNSAPASFVRLVRAYAKNAVVLQRSLASAGCRFTLLTNHSDLIARYAPAEASELNVIEIEFHTPVPRGIRFYSGHYKLDVIRYLGQSADDYLALIDLDVVCVNPVPESLRVFAHERVPLAYDISDQLIPAYGERVLSKQLSEIAGAPRPARWFGGEFLAGPPDFFSALARSAEKIFERYLEVSLGKARVGNEPYQNAALDIVRREGYKVEDAGTVGIIGRYWNMPVRHPQRPFRHFRGCFLIHLPVDKHVLSVMSDFRPRTPQAFGALYRRTKWLWPVLEIKERAHKLLSVAGKTR